MVYLFEHYFPLSRSENITQVIYCCYTCDETSEDHTNDDGRERTTSSNFSICYNAAFSKNITRGLLYTFVEIYHRVTRVFVILPLHHLSPHAHACMPSRAHARGHARAYIQLTFAYLTAQLVAIQLVAIELLYSCYILYS